MKTALLAVLSFVSFFSLVGGAGAEEARHADHEALRAILKTATDALNANKLDDLGAVLAPKFSVITLDQKRFTSLPDLKKHWDSFFSGDHALLKGVELKPSADELTEFLSPTVGVCHGVSADTYHFLDGDTRTMNTRWSAVVVKDGAKWKVASLHIGVDPADNPILEAAKKALVKVGAIGALLGLLIGFFVGKSLLA